MSRRQCFISLLTVLQFLRFLPCFLQCSLSPDGDGDKFLFRAEYSITCTQHSTLVQAFNDSCLEQQQQKTSLVEVQNSLDLSSWSYLVGYVCLFGVCFGVFVCLVCFCLFVCLPRTSSTWRQILKGRVFQGGGRMAGNQSWVKLTACVLLTAFQESLGSSAFAEQQPCLLFTYQFSYLHRFPFVYSMNQHFITSVP